MTGGKEDADQSSVLRFTEVFECVGINPQRHQDTSLPLEPRVMSHRDPQSPCSDLALWPKRCWQVQMLKMLLIQMPLHWGSGSLTCTGGFQSSLADILTLVTAWDVLTLVPTASGLETVRFSSYLGSVPSTAQLHCTGFRKILCKVTSG